MFRKGALLFAIAFSFSLIPLSAQEAPDDSNEDTSNVSEAAASNSFWDNVSWAIHGNVMIFFGNEKQGTDPSPIVPSLGASAAWNFAKNMRLEVTEDIYFNYYEYKDGTAYPCNQPNRSAMVIGLVTGVQYIYLFPIGKTGILVRAFAGPVIDIRLAFLAPGLNHPDDFTGDIETDPSLQTDAIRKYFWENARWLYGVVGAGIDFPLSDKFLLGLDLRLWIPLSTAKDLRFGFGFRITPLKNS